MPFSVPMTTSRRDVVRASRTILPVDRTLSASSMTSRGHSGWTQTSASGMEGAGLLDVPRA